MRSTLRATSWLTPLVVVLGACQLDSPLAPAVSDGSEVVATPQPDGIRLSNGTSKRVGFVVRNPEWLGLFAPCIDVSPGCLRLAPNNSVVVPFADILGYGEGVAAVVVTWWTVEAVGAGEYRIEEMHEIRVPLD